MINMIIVFLCYSTLYVRAITKDSSTLRYVQNLHTTNFGIKSYRTSATYINLIFEACITYDTLSLT